MLRDYPNNPLYCSRLQSPMPALSAKNVLNVEKTTPGEHFWPAALTSNSAIGGQVFARPHNDPVIRIALSVSSQQKWQKKLERY